MRTYVHHLLYLWLGCLFLLLLPHPAPASTWDGPRSGPAAQPGKTIVYIAEDLKNGGILSVGEGVREAAKAIGWHLHVLDTGTSDVGREMVFRAALAKEPDGLIFGGGDAHANSRFLSWFAQKQIPIVTWHSAPFPGPVEGTPIFTNITTNSLDVAREAANLIIEHSKGKAGVVIFTDSRFEIALKKSQLMAEAILACPNCTLLAIEDIPLNRTSKLMPQAIRRLLTAYGSRRTHTLGINDLYFDHAISELILAGRSAMGPPFNISAGDGSPSAFLRIRNHSYQEATVPEPLLMHGWQLVDELNRAMTGHPPSGYCNPPYLVTADNFATQNTAYDIFDPDNNYRSFYKAIWQGRAASKN